MKKTIAIAAVLVAALAATTGAHAAKVVDEIQIEGMVSPASPKALSAALESQLAVKVLGYDFYGTENGWPIIRVEYDSSAVSRDQIEKVIDTTKDPGSTGAESRSTSRCWRKRRRPTAYSPPTRRTSPRSRTLSRPTPPPTAGARSSTSSTAPSATA